LSGPIDCARRLRTITSTDRAELLANFALRVFDRLELLQILESAACDTEGRLQGMVRYLLTAEHGQDEREGEVLAQLTNAVVRYGTSWRASAPGCRSSAIRRATSDERPAGR
jgi:hypothetical protein